MTSRRARCSESDLRSKLTPFASRTIRCPPPRRQRTPSSIASTSRCARASSLDSRCRLRLPNGNGDLIATLLTTHRDPQVIDQKSQIGSTADGERQVELREVRLNLIAG